MRLSTKPHIANHALPTPSRYLRKVTEQTQNEVSLFRAMCGLFSVLTAAALFVFGGGYAIWRILLAYGVHGPLWACALGWFMLCSLFAKRGSG